MLKNTQQPAATVTVPTLQHSSTIPIGNGMDFFTNGNTIKVLALSDWLDMAAGRHHTVGVDLPMIQRGFVWKPQQIIDLWDSLLMGMPIGALMVSELRPEDAHVALSGTPPHQKAPQRLGLVDGQQRTLAMLLGWSAFVIRQSKHRLWVDLADEPAPGHLVRLRVSSSNQPFGYRRDDPNSKLSLDQRRRAKEAYADMTTEYVTTDHLLTQAHPHPAGAKYSAPLDLGELVQEWRNKKDVATWQSAALEKMKNVATVVVEDDKAVLKLQWSEEQEEKIKERLQNLTDGLQRLFSSQIPLIRVHPKLFQTDSTENVEPPLARLFQRIGSNTTPLSDADYIYAVLKHLEPKVHRMVESLHSQPGVAGFLTATDLVMSTLRLAAVKWKDVSDDDNPNKEGFHRMVIRPKNADAQQRQKDMHTLLPDAGPHTLARYFAIVQANLQYQGQADIGLPRLMLPYLGRPLVQVLLRLAQAGYLQDPADENLRAQGLRLVLWWMRWVWDKPKASRIAFQVIKNSPDGWEIDHRIAQAVVEAGAGFSIHSPAAIAVLGLDNDTYGKLKDESRFATPEGDSENNRLTREFYRHWWQPWSHRHPLLLWLQRDYVERFLDAPAQAGVNDDTPYDFDHILPSAHWSIDWRIVGKNGSIEDFRHARRLLGNSIGNIRIWDASHNRSDGDASPKEKLHKAKNEREQWLKNSRIEHSHEIHWLDCSPAKETQKTFWDRPRALAFQQAVENRSFSLYQQLYQEAQFEKWE